MMKQTFIRRENSSHLILFFAGWGMDTTPFREMQTALKETDTTVNDLLVCYDYRTLHFDESLCTSYQEITVVAWSMGVWVATQVLSNSTLPLVRCIAINGTPYPIDDVRGISTATFEGTLKGLNEVSLAKFQRRMCGSASAHQRYRAVAPQRCVAELKTELEALGMGYAQRLNKQFSEQPQNSLCWDKAIIGTADRIFSPENQRNAWQGVSEVIYVDAPHYDERLFNWSNWTTEQPNNRTTEHLKQLDKHTKQGSIMKDKSLMIHRFGKASKTYTRQAIVQQKIAHKMIGLVRQHLPIKPLKQVVEFGCGTGIYSRLLLEHLEPQKLILNDICSEMKEQCEELLGSGVSFVAADAELLSLPKQTELITSCSTLQWFEKPDEFFKRCNRALHAEGYLAFTTFGEKNMQEIRELTGQGLLYRTLTDLNASLSELYDVVYTEEEVIPLHFDHPMEVLHHIKLTGVTTTQTHQWTRQSLHQFCSEYTQRFAQNERVRLTYHPIYIIAKKKTENREV